MINKIEPELKNVDSFKVEGVCCRTSNLEELNILTAKIPNLWADFSGSVYSSRVVRKGIVTPEVFGVYYDFDSDVNSKYTLMAGIKEQDDSNGRLRTVEVESGEYLVFTRKGQMPQAVVSAWFDIWEYFKDSDVEYERLYKTDFERYLSSEHVEVYVGVKKKNQK